MNGPPNTPRPRDRRVPRGESSSSSVLVAATFRGKRLQLMETERAWADAPDRNSRRQNQ